MRFQEELLECAAVGENTALDMLIEFRAAGRAQGVREGIEECAQWHDRKARSSTDAANHNAKYIKDYKWAEMQRANADRHTRHAKSLRALAAPEPQEPQTAKRPES